MNPPQIRERVLDVDEPWERVGGLHYFSQVMEIDGEFRIYYGIQSEKAGGTIDSVNCLATSKDGLVWKKPALGVYDYKGSTQNNVTGALGFGGGFVVDDGSPAQRFRKLGQIQSGAFGITATSTDGIHFTGADVRLGPVHQDGLLYGFDSQNLVLRDDEIGKWIWFLRGWDGSYSAGKWTNNHRSALRGESAGLESFINGTALVQNGVSTYPTPYAVPGWKDALGRPKYAAVSAEFPKVFMTDAADWAAWAGGANNSVDLYNTCAVKYPWASGVWLAFPAVYYHYTASTQPPMVNGNDGEFEPQLAESRNGKAWTRFRTADGHPPFVPRGIYDQNGLIQAGRVDGPVGTRMYMISMTQGMIRRGDTIYQYFYALPRSHGWAANIGGVWGTFMSDPARKAAWAADGFDRGGIYRAEQRLDGFVSLDAGTAAGTLVSHPFTCQGDRLRLNFKSSAGGVAAVTLLDDAGLPLTAESDAVMGDAVDHPVTWNGDPQLAPIQGRAVRLKIRMKSAKLYAFEISSAAVVAPPPPASGGGGGGCGATGAEALVLLGLGWAVRAKTRA